MSSDLSLVWGDGPKPTYAGSIPDAAALYDWARRSGYLSNVVYLLSGNGRDADNAIELESELVGCLAHHPYPDDEATQQSLDALLRILLSRDPEHHDRLREVEDGDFPDEDDDNPGPSAWNYFDRDIAFDSLPKDQQQREWLIVQILRLLARDPEDTEEDEPFDDDTFADTPDASRNERLQGYLAALKGLL